MSGIRLILTLSDQEMKALLDGPVETKYDWCAGYGSDDPSYPEDILCLDDSGGYSIGRFTEPEEALFVAIARNAITRALAGNKKG